jgi:hypothetical protein
MAEDPATTALTVLALARADDFEGIQELFAIGLRSMVSADALRAAWLAELAELGSITSVGDPLSEPAGNGTVVKLPVGFERGERTIVVVVGGDGMLASLQVAPAEAGAPVAAWEPPSYAHPDAFSEHDVLDGTGTLSVPHGAGPWPAVVMLPGSGPNDRDGTLGPNKPLKDIAWGLAGQGIAVLRFDKVTYGRRAERARHPEFTMVDEYVPDAIAAIRLLGDGGVPAAAEQAPREEAVHEAQAGQHVPGPQAPDLQAAGEHQPGQHQLNEHAGGQATNDGQPAQQQPAQQQPGQQQLNEHTGGQATDDHQPGLNP